MCYIFITNADADGTAVAYSSMTEKMRSICYSFFDFWCYESLTRERNTVHMTESDNAVDIYDEKNTLI